jgi:hypothetical protein
MSRNALFLFGAIAATIAVAPVAAQAQYGGGYGHDRAAPAYDGYDGHDGPRFYRDRRIEYDRGDGYGDRDGRGAHGRRYSCRRDGTGGAIVGAIAGGLLGNAVAGYGDRAAGTILGGVGGALAGRAIDRDC